VVAEGVRGIVMDFLDSERIRWIIVTLVPLVVGSGVIFGPWLLTRRRKNLSYRTSVYPVVIEGLEEQVELLFQGQHVPDAYVSIITLHYRGNEPIVEDDFRTPVTFDFGDTRVLSAEVIRTQPKGINATLTLRSGNRVGLEPISLNNKNRIEARVLTTNPTQPTVSGHIVGVTEIRDQDRAWPWRITFVFTSLSITLLGAILVLIDASTKPSPEPPPLTPLGVIGLKLSYLRECPASVFLWREE
jgi:hypothetical protein